MVDKRKKEKEGEGKTKNRRKEEGTGCWGYQWSGWLAMGGFLRLTVIKKKKIPMTGGKLKYT